MGSRTAAPRRRASLLRLASLALLVAFGASLEGGDFDLPGTQQDVPGTPAAAKIQQVFIPPIGTPPTGTVTCDVCHASSDLLPGTPPSAPSAAPLAPWHGSMMSMAARDPLFYAQLDLTNHDGRLGGPRPAVAGMADMCLRCHSPVGWLEGRSTDLTGQGFTQKDLFGVQCHACHRLVDPRLPTTDPSHPDVTNFLNGLLPTPGLPPTFGNGMFVMDPRQTRRGPYRLAQLVGHTSSVVGEGLDWGMVNLDASHPAMGSAFHRSGNLCGTCHDVSNPVDCEPGATNADTQRCFPIERTWSEWRASAFPARGEAGNCQSCHMSGPLNGVAFGAPCQGAGAGGPLAHLNDVHFHDLTGGNTFIPKVIRDMKQRYDTPCAPGDTACSDFKLAVEGLYPPATGSPFANVDPDALLAGIERVKRTLKRAAYLDVTGVSPELQVRVTNRTGHKLPTGYPEGRRMWLNVKFLSSTGSLLAESGRYEAATGALFHDQDLNGTGGGPLSYDVASYTDSSGGTLGIGRLTKVWEGRMRHVGTDTEFHFALNDEVELDNRIPPEGWNLAEYTANRALPSTSVYPASLQSDYGAGGGPTVNFDQFSYELPAGTDRVELTLYYQTASREYIEALADDNPHTAPGPGSLHFGGFNRGTLLQDAWQRPAVGRSEPEVMARRVHAVLDGDSDGLSDGWESGFGGALGGRNDDPDGDGRSNWQELQDGTDPTDPASPGGLRDPVDIVLVLDLSGSMNDPAPGTTTPKIQVLRDAVTLFLETWKDYAVGGANGDRIGVVYFRTDALAYGAPPLLKNFVSEWTTIRGDVQGQMPGGWTAMGAGLYTAVQGLPAAPGRKRHILLFSNGMQNRSPMVVPHPGFPDSAVVLRDQTPADNPEVTGGSNVTLGAGVDFSIPFTPANQIFVHTVGVGVAEASGGSSWHKLLRDLATFHGGKHNFITRAFDLEGVFLQDLVNALRGNSLEYVLEEEMELARGEVEEVSIPVNGSATQFSVVVSWSGERAEPPLLELLRPDGVREDLAPLTRGGSFYRVITRYLSDPDSHPEEFGVWKLRLARRGKQRESGRAGEKVDPGLPVRVHALLDDAQVKYHFTVPPRLRIGQPLRVTAIATQRNQLLRDLGQVTVRLSRPRRSLGEALARSRHSLPDAAGLDPDLVATPFARKLAAAFADKQWRERLEPEEDVLHLRDDGIGGDEQAGDGIFGLRLPMPEVPGHYEVAFRMDGRTADGRALVREESFSLVVGIGPIDPVRSRVRLVEHQRGRAVSFRPMDRDGNLLGPGYASQIVARTHGRLAPVEDLLDGSYRVSLPAGFAPGGAVRLTFDDSTFQDGPVRPAGFWERIPWWVWLLLLLLLLLLLVVWLLRRRP